MTRASPSYVRQDSSQSLREALAEYYRDNPDLLEPRQMDAHAAALFRQHDAAHAVFGCDTSLRGETLIDTWTIFGSTLGFRGYLEYLKLPQVDRLFAEAGWLRIARQMLRCLPDILRIVWRSRRLSAKWPWSSFEEHYDRPLREIRRQFGIRVV